MSDEKKKLMVVVGSGASVELGMPSVLEIDELFCQWSNEQYKLSINKNPSLYSYIRDKVNQYYLRNSKRELEETNFEEVLYVILQLSTALGDGFFNLPMNAFLGLKRLPKIITSQGEKAVDGNDLWHLCCFLNDKLIAEFRERCKSAKASKHDEFGHFNSFITQLNKDYDVAFISLNYDNLITKVCPDLFTGFNESSGDFDVSSIYERNKWGFIYHLHGSVHFDMQIESDDIHTIKWKSDFNSRFSGNSFGRNPQNISEKISMPTSVIVTGYEKANQIQRIPFRTYYSQLDEIALTADAFLFLGYGFNDLHLNNCFQAVKKEKRTKNVVIVDSFDVTKNNICPMKFYSKKSAKNLCNTLSVEVYKMKTSDDFVIPINPDSPLSIWHDGFINACKNYKKIKERIDRIMGQT